MSETPLSPVPDEIQALEARIVASILGDASAFEEADLDRLCRERPELHIFRRRMTALHELLAEAESATPHPDWQLPPAKRGAIEALAGAPAAEDPTVKPAVPARHHALRWWLPAVAACLVLGFIGYVGFGGLVKSAKYNARMADAAEKEMLALEVDYPAELIQGTPTPMNLPERTPTPADRMTRRDALARSSMRSGAEMEVAAAGGKPPGPPRTPAPPASSARTSSAGVIASRAPSREHPQPPSAPAGPSAAPGLPPPGGGAGGSASLGLDGSLAAADADGDVATRGNRARGLERGEADGLDDLSLADAKPAAAKEMADESRKAGAVTGEREEVGRLALRSEAETPPPPAAGQQAADRYVWSGQSQPGEPGLPTLSTRAKEDQGKLAVRSSDAEVTGKTQQDVPAIGGIFNRPAGSAGEAKKAETTTATAEARDLDEQSATAKLGKAIQLENQGIAEEEAREKAAPPAKPAPPPASNETSAADDPFSTFSLNISDASFRTAYAALAAGRRPDPADIRPEQFYNAFDYGDPYPSANEAMAARIEQCVHPMLPGRHLVRVALRTAASGRAASQPLHLTLLIDQSGSMARADRKAAVAHALGQIAGLLGPQDRVTAIGFSLGHRLLADSVPGDQAATIPGLAAQDAIEGGTHLQGALAAAKDIATARLDGKARGRIVLLTDGAANLGSADPAALANIVRDMRAAGLAFDVAGIGTNELNDRLLAELARHGNGRFHVVAAQDGGDELARQLAGAFRPAAENVKVQVRFNPSRVGGYRLIGFEKDRLKTEDFRNDAVDAAEMAAEEAGVAIYQVEVLHDGVGGIGEVSARFRDTATDRMVEQSWVIPYQAGAPALDRANPSMQLAATAVLCAEKLAAGPAAGLIDFSDYQAVTANLRQHFPASARVRELLEMVDKLR